MNKPLLLMAAALVGGAISFNVMAQSKDPTKMTCEDFLAMKQDTQVHVYYWLHGYHKRGAAQAQPQAMEWVSDPPLPELIDLCKQSGKDTVSVKVQQLLTLKK